MAYEKTPPSKPGSSSVYLAQAWSDWAGGVFGDCLLTVFDSATSDSAALVSAVLAHEMFHCFQFDAYRTLDLEAIIPAWVMEGQATWVGEEIGGPSGVVGHWKKYLQAPYVDLRQRTYDAIGFYSHLAEIGVEPWDIFRPMWDVGTNTGALFDASGANRDDFLYSWASSVHAPVGSQRGLGHDGSRHSAGVAYQPVNIVPR